MSEAIRHTPKLAERQHDGISYYIFWCPGCKCGHSYCVGGPTSWEFNGDVEEPTFKPSLLNYNEISRCHLFIIDGKISYCGDCSHELAGTTIDMAPIPVGYGI
jgi:hypothetical protein